MKLYSIGANKTELHIKDAIVLFSYNTPVAATILGKGHFKTSQRFSVTTSRHINDWVRGYDVEEKTQEFFEALLQIKLD